MSESSTDELGTIFDLIAGGLPTAARALVSEEDIQAIAFSIAARPATDGVSLIAAERQRQIDVEGYDVGHDSVHGSDALTQAAVCYATPAHMRLALSGRAPLGWPWGVSHWKPTPDDRVRELVKAGALIAAEIDRLNRLASS